VGLARKYLNQCEGKYDKPWTEGTFLLLSVWVQKNSQIVEECYVFFSNWVSSCLRFVAVKIQIKYSTITIQLMIIFTTFIFVDFYFDTFLLERCQSRVMIFGKRTVSRTFIP
jgi:hypothetical protein